MSDFHDTLFKGNVFKELVKILLEKSDYLVIPYGYENPFSNVKKKLSARHAHDSPTALRIRSSPDLLIYDDQADDVKLVEVKMSSYPSPRFKQSQIETYKQFWNDAVLVLVLPFENVFYVQEIAKLGIKEQYDPKTDFKRIQEMFGKINVDDVRNYGTIACNLIKVMKSRSTGIENQP